MRTYHGIYQDGVVTFCLHLPDVAGPVAVIVVFPGPEDEPEPEDLAWDWEEFEENPF